MIDGRERYFFHWLMEKLSVERKKYFRLEQARIYSVLWFYFKVLSKRSIVTIVKKLSRLSKTEQWRTVECVRIFPLNDIPICTDSFSPLARLGSTQRWNFCYPTGDKDTLRCVTARHSKTWRILTTAVIWEQSSFSQHLPRHNPV